MVHIALLGGLDPTGGAGLLRDAWTIAAQDPDARVHAIATALTRQGHARPAEVFPVAPERLDEELARLDALERLDAIKLGMLPGELVDAIAAALGRFRLREPRPKIVLDPVLLATDGGRLGAAPEQLRALARLVDLLTPNATELALLGPLSGVAVLHKAELDPSAPERVRDRLCMPEGSEHVFERPRVVGPDPRGTGCALASSIALHLARKSSMIDAVEASITWLDAARQRLHRGPDRRWHLRPGGLRSST